MTRPPSLHEIKMPKARSAAARAVDRAASEGGREGALLRRRREADLKRRDRAKLAELRARLRHSKTERPRRLKEIRTLCRIGRENVRARVTALRDETLTRLRETIAALRAQQADACAADKRTARVNLTKEINEAHAELAEQKRLFASFYGRKKTGRTAAAERRAESDDEVIRNLPPELVPVFRHVRQWIKGGPRRTRTEAFFEWVEGNTAEAHAILYDQVERDVARLVEEEGRISRRLRKARPYEDPEEEAHALAAAPF